MEQKQQVILKRPEADLSKKYKEYKEGTYKKIVSSIKNKQPIKVLGNEIPGLFLLDETHLNLPDMNLSELKMVFPYFFDKIVWASSRMKELSFSELEAIYALSEKKRIPLILGKEFEVQEYGKTWRDSKLEEKLQKLIEQENPEIIASYMPMILKAGVFPGVDMSRLLISTVRELTDLWRHYSQTRNNLYTRLQWYIGIDEHQGGQMHHCYLGDKLEIEWKLIEFLQIRLLDWERKCPLIKGLIQRIETKAFADCEFLHSVKIEKDVAEIGYCAFQNCVQLKEIFISDSVIFLGSGAFMNCRCLKEVSLPADLNMIGDDIFSNCTSLEKICQFKAEIMYKKHHEF